MTWLERLEELTIIMPMALISVAGLVMVVAYFVGMLDAHH